MPVRDAHQAPESESLALLTQGKMLAKQGACTQARARFARVLAQCPDHVESLLWLAGLSPDPRQTIRHLNHVLEVSPGHPKAIAGLKWARRRLQSEHARRRLQSEHARQEPVPVQQGMPLLDKLLLSGILLMSLAACVILAAMAWGAPEAVRAAYMATPTTTLAQTLTATATFTPLPTHTPAPTETPTAIATPTLLPPTATATRVVAGEPGITTPLGTKRIELDLSDQVLTAYEGETAVYDALVSTGVPSMPTPLGAYKIFRKVRSQVMSGPGYYLPNVEFVSYFFRGYAIHGTYWHSNFGHPMSHGCVNMTNKDAQWVYSWAPKGTQVIVRP
jgi:lipoprotein-anchoring transpeptidase ErfK/SrfK